MCRLICAFCCSHMALDMFSHDLANMKHPVVTTQGTPPSNDQQHKLPWVIDLLLSKNFTRGLDVIPNTKIHKKSGSHIGSVTQSIHQSENTKIKLITKMKQRRVLFAYPTLDETLSIRSSQCFVADGHHVLSKRVRNLYFQFQNERAVRNRFVIKYEIRNKLHFILMPKLQRNHFKNLISLTKCIIDLKVYPSLK